MEKAFKLLRRLSARTSILHSHSRCTSAASSACVGDDRPLPQISARPRPQLPQGPPLEHFIANSVPVQTSADDAVTEKCETRVPYLNDVDIQGNNRKVFFYRHGCQMNFSDAEVVWSILQSHGYLRTEEIAEADVVLVMTCSVREGAEQKIWKKLNYLAHMKRRRPATTYGGRMKIAILGCMAERLKTEIVEREKMVDVVCGPDAYRDLPRLLATTTSHQAAVNVFLSLEETYADVMPVRLNDDSTTAFVSIMRGCDNMCSYCIVPFTRGRERSRQIDSIVDEVLMLSNQGIREITLLGQNVNSYRDTSTSTYYSGPDPGQRTSLVDGFRTVYKSKSGGRRFSDLLDKVSLIDPEMRIRFTSPHPKDFPDEVLHLMKERDNVSKQIHLPAQCGNNEVLQAMRRGYTIEAYLQLVDRIRTILPDVAISSDFIVGFCGETAEAHQQTVDLLRRVRYSKVFCFPYSMRQKTRAYHHLKDDVPDDVKWERDAELRRVCKEESEMQNKTQIGQHHLVLVEKISKKSASCLSGRNDGGLDVVFPISPLPCPDGSTRDPRPGDYVDVQIEWSSTSTFGGKPVKITTLQSSELEHRQAAGGDEGCDNSYNNGLILLPIHSD